MMRNTTWWLDRIAGQLTGWWVWHSSAGWQAVPAPKPRPVPIDPRPDWYMHLPNRIGPYATPQQLRTECKARYGWDDWCDTCGILARDCGHRQPERDER